MRLERAITPTWHGENLIWLQFVKGKSRACGLLQAPKRLRANLPMPPYPPLGGSLGCVALLSEVKHFDMFN